MLDNQLSTVETKLNELKQELSEQISKCHAILTSEGKGLKPPKFITSTIVSTINAEKERKPA